MFSEMIERVQTTTISRLLKGKIIRIRPGMPIPGARRPMPQSAPAAGLPANSAAAPVAAETASEKTEAPAAAESVPAESAAQPAQAEPQPAPEMPAQPAMPSANAGRAPFGSNLSMRPQEFAPNPTGKQAPLVRDKKKEVGRNDPCPCGSGKKYKDCCYWKDHK